ncbi:MAG TPA: Ltp family lipoprotein [Propionicimonas sp.]|jgi:hypothetical protein
MREHTTRIFIGASIFVVAAVLTACSGASGSPIAPVTSAASNPTTQAAPATTTAAAPAAPTTPAGPVETAAQKNARQKAADYLNIIAFSHDGLVEQLVQGDQFAQADAVYGVDAQHADWNAEAVKKAKDYLAISSFSHKSLVDQLVQGDKFTPAQAEAGVTGAGL